MKKGYIKTNWPDLCNRQSFWIFTENDSKPVTTHLCSNSWYAEYDLLRHDEVKEFDVIYWLKGNIVYMNWEMDQSAKDKFNDAENLWWASNYWTLAPSSHTV